MATPEFNDSVQPKEITLEEARRELEEWEANFVPNDEPGTDGGRTFHRLMVEALNDPEALQAYVNTRNDIIRQQRELDAGF
jgi:hypothetical protein